MRRIASVALLLVAVLAVASLLRDRARRPTTAGAGVGESPAWPPLGPLPADVPGAEAAARSDPSPTVAPVVAEPARAQDDAAATAWRAPAPDGSCPASHPVKAKLDSRIFHVPGGRFYDRTRADRCYPDAATASADGYRASKA